MINNSFRALASAVSTTVGQPSSGRAVLLLPGRYSSTIQNDHGTPLKTPGTENLTNTIFTRALVSKPPKSPGSKTSNPVPISTEKRPLRPTGSTGIKCANGKCGKGENTAKNPSISTEHTWREKIYKNSFAAREGLRSRAEMRYRSPSWGRSSENEPMGISNPHKSPQTPYEDEPIPKPKYTMGSLLESMDEKMTSNYDPIFGNTASLKIKTSEKESQAEAEKEKDSDEFCDGGVCRPKIIKSKKTKPGKNPSKGCGAKDPTKYTSSRSVHSKGEEPGVSAEPLEESRKDTESSPLPGSPASTLLSSEDVNEKKAPDVSDKAAQPKGNEGITPSQPIANKSITPNTEKKEEPVQLLEEKAFFALLKDGGNTNATPNQPKVGHSRSKLPKEVTGGHPAIVERLENRENEANLFVSTEKPSPNRAKIGKAFGVTKDLSKTDGNVIVHITTPEKAKKLPSINKRKSLSAVGVGINRATSGTRSRDLLRTPSANLPSKYKINNVVKNVASSIEKKVISKGSSVLGFLKKAKSTEEGTFFNRNSPVSALNDKKENKESVPVDSKNTAALNRSARLSIFNFLKTASSSDVVSIKKLVDKIKKR